MGCRTAPKNTRPPLLPLLSPSSEECKEAGQICTHWGTPLRGAPQYTHTLALEGWWKSVDELCGVSACSVTEGKSANDARGESCTLTTLRDEAGCVDAVTAADVGVDAGSGAGCDLEPTSAVKRRKNLRPLGLPCGIALPGDAAFAWFPADAGDALVVVDAVSSAKHLTLD